MIKKLLRILYGQSLWQLHFSLQAFSQSESGLSMADLLRIGRWLL